MALTVTPATLDEKPVLARLLQLYQYDFTEFVPLSLGDDGLYPYRYLDAYWSPEPGGERYPLLFRVDGELAGFALVRFLNQAHVMSEFFVMRPFRRRGIGAEAAKNVFSRFSGRWIVHEVPGNRPAQAFWRSVISEFTHGDFEETVDADGVTQRFVSS
jgi:predicted acetyltransferase